MATIGTLWLCTQSALHNSVCPHRCSQTHRSFVLIKQRSLLLHWCHMFIHSDFTSVQRPCFHPSSNQPIVRWMTSLVPSVLCCRTAVCYTPWPQEGVIGPSKDEDIGRAGSSNMRLKTKHVAVTMVTYDGGCVVTGADDLTNHTENISVKQYVE